MKQTSDTPKKQPLLARIVALLMTLVFSGAGLLSYFSLYTPARSTRFGYAGSLFGQDAQAVGLAMFVIGLLPLAIFARTSKQVGWFLAVILVLFWAAVFLPLFNR